MRAPDSQQGTSLDRSVYRNLGLALKVLRGLRHVSQAALARRAGLGKSQLSKYESGKELPRLDSLERALTALGTGPLALFYVVHLLDQLEDGDSSDALLLGASAEPLLGGPEREAFTRLITDIVDLFQAQVSARLTDACRKSAPGWCELP